MIFSASAQPSFVRDSLDNYVVKEMERWRVPGLALAILKDGKIVKLRGYGVKHVGVYGAKADSVDENTLFMIGSCSKAFTATALAALESEALLALNDKVTKWIPNFRLYETSATQQAIITDLLSHRSGLRTFQGDFTYWGSNLSRSEIIEKFGLNRPVAPFRTRYGYCNAGFLTAGEIVPKVTGKSWEATIRERFFVPLGMTRSVALASEFGGTSNHADGHTLYDERVMRLPVAAIDNLAPAGSIGSSVRDLTQWAMMQLDTGKLGGKEIFKPQAIMRTWRAETIVSPFRNGLLPTNFMLYGLGWFVSDYAGKQLIEHDGGVDGFTATFSFMPSERLAVIVLTNTDANSLYASLKWRILDAYLREPVKDYSALLHANSEKAAAGERKTLNELKVKAAAKPAPAFALQRYVGKYVHSVYGELTVEQQGSALRVILSHHPTINVVLEPLGEHKFLCTYSNPVLGIHEVRFGVSSGANSEVNSEANSEVVTSLTLKVNDFVEYDGYTFLKR